MAQVKELIGEEKLEVVLKEVDAGGEEEKVFIKIRTAMDPFFISVDNPDDCRTTADVMDNFPPADPEDFDKDAIYDRKLPRSDFGPYCPITYVRDGYMFKGNPEIESTLRGKTYVFAGEAEQEEFKFNPEKYLVVQKGL
jgi:adenylate/nucleoside-diphosphate kinase